MARPRLQTYSVPSGMCILMGWTFSVAFCFAPAASAQAEDSAKTSGDASWTKSSETNSPYTNPSRTTESHSKSGDRTVDKRKVEVLGPNGGYQPSFEIETETVQVDSSTTRTVTRTYRWDGNGQKALAQVTEEDSHASAGGNTHVERKSSEADVNGNLQVVRREFAETRKVGPDAEETKSTVYRADSYGGFSQAEQTQEVKTHNADDSVAVKTTNLLPDGNGKWRISRVTEKTIKEDGKNRTTEETDSRPDLEGRLSERSRTVSKEAETPTGERRSTVETYSVAPGYSERGMRLSQRVTTIQKKDSDGEETEQQFEEPYAANPSDGPKLTARTKYVVRYAGPGTQQTTRSVELRDANGNFSTFQTQNSTQTETQKSTQPPPAQKPAAPPEKP